MNQKQLKKLIGGGESQTAEFKQSFAEMKEILEAICAFANTEAGTVLVGVSDKCEVIGLKIGKDTVEKIPQKIRETIDPNVFPSISVEKIEGKRIVAIEIPEAHEKPVFFKNVAYKRVGRANRKLSASEVRKLAKETSEKVYWDEQICVGATPGDINEEKVRWFLKEARMQRGLDIPENTLVCEALMRLDLTKNKKLTNAALLLFGNELGRFFTRPEIKCIRFKGTGVTGHMIDFKVIEGNLFDQMIECEKFIYNNIKMAAWIEAGKLQRQEKWDYPADAIREALANALCHRGYQTSSGVQVRIFDDRMEFWNPGRLPDGWTIENLKQKHKSNPRNPLLLKHFFWVKYVEEVGTGTNKLIDWCKEWGLPEPLFEIIADDFIVTFRKQWISDEILKELNERQAQMIEYLRGYEGITKKEYMNMTNISKTHAFRDIEWLLNRGIIEMNGSGRNIHYILKGPVRKGPKKDRKRTEKKHD